MKTIELLVFNLTIHPSVRDNSLIPFKFVDLFQQDGIRDVRLANFVCLAQKAE